MRPALFLLLLVVAVAAQPSDELATRLISSILHGDAATHDPFSSLTAAELRAPWLLDGADRTFPAMASSLGSFSHDVLVDVVLVGFRGLGLSSLQRLFATASNSHWNAHPVTGLDGVPLNVTNHLLFSVSRTSPQLQAAVDAARRAAAAAAARVPARSMTSHEGDTQLLLVDPAPIYAILADDYRRRGKDGVAIYVLDEPASDNHNNNDDDADMPLFAYVDDADLVDVDKRGRACPHSASASRHGKHDPRLIWIDLAAGPLRYGPATSGAGTVTHVTVPSAFEEVLHAVDASSTSAAERSVAWVERSEFLVSLAVLLQKTAQQLLVPAVQRGAASAVQMQPWRALRFRLHWLRETPADLRLDSHTSAARFNATPVEQLLADQLDWFDDRPVHFDLRERATPLSSSFDLSDAYFSSLRSSLTAAGTVDRHIDSAALHAALRQWLTSKNTDHTDNDSSDLTVPIVLLDFLSPHSPLFEGRQRLAVFDDMAVVLRLAGSAPVSHPLKCESRTVTAAVGDASRPLLAAMLSTAWNIAPVDQYWDEAHGRPAVDYLWATAPGPYGEMSNALSLSFYHADLAKRNHVYALLLAQRRRLMAHLQPLALTGFHLHDLLSPRRFELYTQRWNLLHFKLHEAATFLAMQSYRNALRFVQAADHDALVVEALLREARTAIKTSLSCTPDARQPRSAADAPRSAQLTWFEIVVGPVLSLVLLAYVVLRVVLPRLHAKTA